MFFPKFFPRAFAMKNLYHAAESLPSPVLENLACFSEANDCIILGSIIQKDSGGGRGKDCGEMLGKIVEK